MKHLFRKAWALALAGASIFCLCTGCHGTAERTTFALPDAFDTSKSYEVTFFKIHPRISSACKASSLEFSG